MSVRPSPAAVLLAMNLRLPDFSILKSFENSMSVNIKNLTKLSGDNNLPGNNIKKKVHENTAAFYYEIRNFLAGRGCRLWIWGDRLIDGKTTG